MSYIITTVHKHFFYQMFCKNGVTIAFFTTKDIPAPSCKSCTNFINPSFLWRSGAPSALTARALATRHREPTPPQPKLYGAPNQPFIRERRASRHQACDPTVRGHLRIRGLPGSPARKERGGPRTGPSQGHFRGYAETARAWARNGAGGAEIGILGPSVTGVSPFPHNFPTPDLFKFDSRVRYQLRFTSGAWEPSRPRAEPTAILLSSASTGEGDVGSAGDLPTSRLWFLCRPTKLALVPG